MKNAKQFVRHAFMWGLGLAATAGCQSAPGHSCPHCAAQAAAAAAAAASSQAYTQSTTVSGPQGRLVAQPDASVAAAQTGAETGTSPEVVLQPTVTHYASVSENIDNNVTPMPIPTAFASVPEVRSGSMAHAQDYSWLEGTLEYTHSDSGRWKLRYAPLSEEDPFGGSVVLDPDPKLQSFQPGDLVRIEGELVQLRSSVYVSGPLYRIHTIQPISR
jgi:hypothetical protein